MKTNSQCITDTYIEFALELKGLYVKRFCLFFFGEKVQIIFYSDGMNTRNSSNYAKTQLEVEKTQENESHYWFC